MLGMTTTVLGARGSGKTRPNIGASPRCSSVNARSSSGDPGSGEHTSARGPGAETFELSVDIIDPLPRRPLLRWIDASRRNAHSREYAHPAWCHSPHSLGHDCSRAGKFLTADAKG